MAQARDAELALVHVVDDDQPKDLVEIETREAERILAEQIGAMSELRGAKCRPMVVAGDPFDGILRAAESIEADLIVMGAHRKQLLRDIFVGTTIERVIRTGQYPVLMVNNEAKQTYEKPTAAVDMSEPSANAIRAASRGLIDNAGITLLHAFLPLGKDKMSVAGINRAVIDEYVASERLRATDELVAFLAANELGGPEFSLRVEEGGRFRGDFAGSRGNEARSSHHRDSRPLWAAQGAPGERDRRGLASPGRRRPRRAARQNAPEGCKGLTPKSRPPGASMLHPAPERRLRFPPCRETAPRAPGSSE